MIFRKLIVFLTSLVFYCGVHTVAADPATSVQQPSIQVRPLSQALVNPVPARQLASSDSAKFVGNQGIDQES